MNEVMTREEYEKNNENENETSSTLLQTKERTNNTSVYNLKNQYLNFIEMKKEEGIRSKIKNGESIGRIENY